MFVNSTFVGLINRESPAANALRPLAINTYTERPRGRRQIRDKRDGLSKEPAQLTLLRSRPIAGRRPRRPC